MADDKGPAKLTPLGGGTVPIGAGGPGAPERKAAEPPAPDAVTPPKPKRKPRTPRLTPLPHGRTRLEG